MIKFLQRLLCRVLSNPYWLVLLGALLLLGLWLLRRWLWPWLIIALALLVLLALICIARVIAALVRRSCQKKMGDPKGKGSLGSIGPPRVTIPSHTYKRPDPLIYSQSYLMSRGLAVTWDNPDIRLERQGVPVSSSDLAPSTEYLLKARIWNGSTEAPAVNVQVWFSYLSFGIGTTSTPIGETLVNLPVKGAPGLPVIAEMPWTTPGTPGHYCIQVMLVWPDDANPMNNLGQENVSVKAFNSPSARFEFALRNDSPMQRTFRLETDSYLLPARLPCGELAVEDSPLGVAGGAQVSRHLREAHPLPRGWRVEFFPAGELTLAPGALQTVTATVISAGESVPMQAINVNAFADGKLAGGVTLYVHS
jgi:hypothetical protein